MHASQEHWETWGTLRQELQEFTEAHGHSLRPDAEAKAWEMLEALADGLDGDYVKIYPVHPASVTRFRGLMQDLIKQKKIPAS